MKVHQLIEILDELDSDGEVFLVVGEQWPFEHYVHGVAIREDVVGTDADPNAEAAEPPRDRWTAGPSELPRNDVLIVAGSQARYGDPDTWGAARRAEDAPPSNLRPVRTPRGAHVLRAPTRRANTRS